jgi:hypothetical protein
MNSGRIILHLFFPIMATLALLLLVLGAWFCVALKRMENRDGGIWSRPEDVPPRPKRG